MAAPSGESGVMADMPDTMTTMTTTGAVAAVVTIITNIVSRAFSSGQASGSVKQRLTSIESAIVKMQTDFSRLTEVLVDQANLRGELNSQSGRITRAEEDIRDMRRGRGFIKDRSEGGLNGEYP